MTGHSVIAYPGGKNSVGESSGGKLNGRGVLTWGNLVRHVGMFTDGLNPKNDELMGRFNPDGSVHVGRVTNWLTSGGSYFPPLSSSSDAKLSGDFDANGGMSSGQIDWGHKYRYNGPLVGGRPEGKGVFQFGTGTEDGLVFCNVYEGNFRNGKPSGSGKVTFSSVGTFQSSKWTNGTGTGKFCNFANECGDWTFTLF